jgi:hypothetical protein
MPYNGSGLFNPLVTFVDGTLATAEDQNSQDTDIASGLTTAVTRNGQSPFTANIPAGGYVVTGLGTPVNPGDSASKTYVDSTHSYFVRTAINNNNYNIQLTDQYIGVTNMTGPLTFTLPVAGTAAQASTITTASPGQLYIIADESGDCGQSVTLTIQTSGVQLINGQSSYVMDYPYSFVVLECTGTGWTIVSNNPLQYLTQWRRVTVNNANYNIKTTDNYIALTGITGPLIFTLPSANAVPAGQIFWIADESGSITTTNTLTIACGSNTINGQSNYVINVGYSSVALISNGTNGWTIISHPIPNFSAPPGGRLTLVTGTPVMTAAETAISTIYYTPYTSNQISLWNGAQFVSQSFAEVSQSLTDAILSPAAAAPYSFYDIFGWLNSGNFVISRGPAWTNSTTRGYSLNRVQGFLVNASTITNGPAAGYGLYLGTIGTDYSYALSAVVNNQGINYTSETVTLAGSGTYVTAPTFTTTESGGNVSAVTLATEGIVSAFPTAPTATTASNGTGLTITVSWPAVSVSFNPNPAAASGGPSLNANGGAWIGIWNQFNRVVVGSTAQDNKSTPWTYTTNTWRASDNSNNNRVTLVFGQLEDSISAQFSDYAIGAGGSTEVAVGVGVNSVTAPSGTVGQASVYAGVAIGATPIGRYDGYPVTIGSNYFQALEDAPVTSGTASWSGVNNSVQVHQLSVISKY